MERWWAPGDVFIVLAVIALSVFLISRSVAGAGGDSRLEASISVNGKEVRVVALAGETRKLAIDGYQGKSYVEISGGRVRMEDSACPDKLCVKSGWISRPGESIVCLPNRVVIEVRSGEGGPDAVTR